MLPNIPGAVATPADLSAAPPRPRRSPTRSCSDLWQRAGAAYGIPWTVLAAINKVESNFGRNMGAELGGRGRLDAVPALDLARWGVDATGDGVADPWNPRTPSTRPRATSPPPAAPPTCTRAVYAYNHADWYVREVLGLANVYAQSAGVAFSLDRLQERLDEARTAVAAASDRLVPRRPGRARSPRRLRLQRLAAAADAALRAARRGAAGRPERERRAGRRRGSSTAARRARVGARELERARAAAAPSTFSTVTRAAPRRPDATRPAGRSRSAAARGAVSVSHTHHGAPAADIAAPAGSPVYAIAQSVVVSAWPRPDADSAGSG